ncbi:helix-turn-helix transcriptional regulator [Amycolatopsis sp.]|uniref:helix-turn-helix transcriptional regulator n=1 Tax=Amycolatopsis sp. TaxID=37632 RepID=UPI00261A9DF1|nr:helix-turn-helix transcriptional regulator [Amycolatopsis sp.]
MRGSAIRGRKLEELSHFLRSRRARLSPEDLGLNTSRRRRTPGLRREEVAVLAGVGTSWYTWLEQGRDIKVSESVARAISGALRLEPAEQMYLFRLLDMNPTLVLSDDSPKFGDAACDSLVNEWLPNPAVIIDKFWNLRAINEAGEDVLGLGAEDSNLLTAFFTKQQYRNRYVDADQIAQMAVAQFRADLVNQFDDERFTQLIAFLCEQSSEFSQLWESHEVAELQSKTKELQHPQVGRLSFSVQMWQLADREDMRLILHLPEKLTDTKAKLTTLANLRGDISLPRAI